MKLENQVCTVEQTKRLNELGVFQTTHFYWLDRGEESKLMYAANVEAGDMVPLYPAYNSAELGEMLGSECPTVLEPGITMHIWNASSEDHQVMFPGNTEAEARADLLIWLLEKGHRTAEEVNHALTNN